MPKNNIIFPQETFEKQTNGVTFYKEGLLEDLKAQGPGVFESWRYNFDAGKQVFRAEKTGKVFEKRIVKDVHGNPHWTGWMEIPDAEVSGVQAIAINDKPLQLPNSDGAIKLQITPASINAYSKEETLNIVDEKIGNSANRAYIYVKWVTDPATGLLADNPKRVLEITYPDGGVSAQYYLVEPFPGTSGINEDATYWIWDEVITQNPGGASNFFDWISVDIPDLRAFVSYPVFTEHTKDSHFHLKGEYERENWDNASGIISAVSGELHEHIADINHPAAPHITAIERENWNEAYENLYDFPADEKRYVASQSNFTLAYEQIGTSAETNKSVFSSSSVVLKSGESIKDNFLAEFNNLIGDQNIILKTQIDVGSVFTSQTSAWLETDTGLKSKIFTSGNPPIWVIPYAKPFDRIYVVATDTTKTITLQQVNITVTYKQKQTVDIGDNNPTVNQRLVLNLVGPDGDILYNGKSLFEAISGGTLAKSAQWGRIFGDINIQDDLNVKLANLLETKINHADMNSHLRWDVYRDGVIAGLIQQPGNILTEEEIPIGDIGRVNGQIVGVVKDTAIITGIKQKLLDLKQQDKVPYAAKLYIQAVACEYDANNDPLPVWFDTDNIAIKPSQTVVKAEFNWNWPGNTFEVYDEIYLRGNNAQYLDKVKLIISCIQYGDAVAEAKGYQFTVNGTNLFLNSSGNLTIDASSGLLSAFVSGAIENILHNKEISIGENLIEAISGNKQIDIEGNVGETISGDKTVIISGATVIQSPDITLGETYKDYGASGDSIKLYGQEADERYASIAVSGFAATLREDFDTFSGEVLDTFEFHSGLIETEIHDRIEGDTKEAFERVSGIEYLSGIIEERALEIHEAVSDEVSGYVDDIYTHIENELDNYYTKAESDDNYYNKTETYNQAEIDAKVLSVFGEQWDLIIHNDSELANALDNNLFANAKRVLFKTGDYIYTGTKPFDFTNCALVKGEEPVSIVANQSSIINQETTLFETIRVEIGAVGIEYIIDSSGNRIKAFNIAGDMNIPLDKYHKIYWLTLVDDSNVTFTNVVTGRDYTFWLDQQETLKKFNIKNYLHNATELYLDELENQKPRMRTVFNVTGNTETEDNGLLFNEIIPLTVGRIKSGAIRIVLGKTKDKLRFSNHEIDFVQPITLFPIEYNDGESVNIRSRFAHDEAYKNAPDYDWVIKDPGDNMRPLWSGIISAEENDAKSTFTLDVSKIQGSGTELIIDFERPTKRLINVVLDAQFTNKYVTTITNGFGEYQGYYEEVILDVKCTDHWTNDYGEGYFIYKINDDYFDDNKEAQFPWDFYINNGVPENDTIIVTPKFYKNIYNIPKIEITSNPGGDINLTTSNDGKINNRNELNGDKNPAYLNGRKSQDFIYYEDPIYFNEMKYVKTPEDTDNPPKGEKDPISIIDFDDTKIKVQNGNRIQVLDPNLSYINFVTLTGAGLELPWSGKVIHRIKDYTISGLQNHINTAIAGEGTIDDSILHKGYSENNEYNYEIVWDTPTPTYTSGIWEIINGTGKASMKTTGNTLPANTIIAESNGSVTVSFTPEFDPSKKVTKDLYIKAHQDGVRATETTSPVHPKHILTSTTHQLGVEWLDVNGNVILEPIKNLDDLGGDWEVVNDADKDWLTITTDGLITVSDKPVPTDGQPIELKFTAYQLPMHYTLPYPHKINQGNEISTSFFVKIFRNNYRLRFLTTDPHYRGIQNIPVNGLNQAETPIYAIIELENGYKLSDEVRQEMIDQGLTWDNGDIFETDDGVGRLRFYMPYKVVRINIKTTTI
jgi:hypothetical protein